jgi:polysaccharide biosynthesis/export protein
MGSRWVTLLILVAVPGIQLSGQSASTNGRFVDRGYVLGPDDQIVLHETDAPEISEKPFLIGINGNITVPLVGRVEAGGLTVDQLEATLDSRLKEFIRDPHVSVFISDFRSQPVSVLGAVKSPGVYQLRGQKSLYEVLSLAGGPTDTAGSGLTVTRDLKNGPVPLAGAKPDSTNRFSLAHVDVAGIVDGKDPAANIEIKPGDTIAVSEGSANVIYVVGDVEHGGAFSLGENRVSSVLRALSLAGGLGRTAKPETARIIRGSPGAGKPQEIKVNIKQIESGKTDDLALLPQDVLVVPTSSRKVFTTYSVPSAVSAAVYGAIYHF